MLKAEGSNTTHQNYRKVLGTQPSLVFPGGTGSRNPLGYHRCSSVLYKTAAEYRQPAVSAGSASIDFTKDLTLGTCSNLWIQSLHIWGRGEGVGGWGGNCIPNQDMCICVINCFQLVATLWTAARQAPLSMRFSRQEHWSGLLCPPPRDLPNLGTEPTSLASLALAGGFFTTSATWEAQSGHTHIWSLRALSRSSGIGGGLMKPPCFNSTNTCCVSK